jgi:Sterol-sensing domain of SREBP cleavage-activation
LVIHSFHIQLLLFFSFHIQLLLFFERYFTDAVKSNHIYFQILLGLSGVLLVMLSVVASIGLFSFFGVKSTLIIMEVIPFLVLAVSFHSFYLVKFLIHFK